MFSISAQWRWEVDCLHYFFKLCSICFLTVRLQVHFNWLFLKCHPVQAHCRLFHYNNITQIYISIPTSHFRLYTLFKLFKIISYTLKRIKLFLFAKYSDVSEGVINFLKLCHPRRLAWGGVQGEGENFDVWKGPMCKMVLPFSGYATALTLV